MNSKSKLLLVDDHPALRNGLRLLLSQQPNFTLVGEAATGAQALKLAGELAPDLVLMDVHLPDINGLDVSRQILTALPTAKIIVFSSDTSRSLVDEALQAGVCAYLPKTCAMEELLQAIEFVIEGKLYLSPQVSAAILQDYRKNLTEPGAQKSELTDRERQMLRMIAEGQRSKEIAAHFLISPKSVEAYRSRLMKKLGYTSSAELVRFAIREGIIAA